MIAVGLLMLSGGADGLVRGAASLARRVGMSPLVIGLTVVAAGTSMPELMVSVGAALRGSSAMALGNVIGSNIANTALILGGAALVAALKVQAQVIRFDVPVLVVVSLLLSGLLADGGLSRLDGGLLSIGLVAYIGFSIYAAHTEPKEAVQEEFDEGIPQQQSPWLDALFIVGGLGVLVAGAHLLVSGAVAVAEYLDISQAIIGLSVVAVGTSLPELATSVVAAFRQEGDIAIGNAVGSSIFNILGILGVTALVRPLPGQQIGWVDEAVMTGLAVILLPLMRTDYMLSRSEGAVLLLIYAGYLIYLFG